MRYRIGSAMDSPIICYNLGRLRPRYIAHWIVRMLNVALRGYTRRTWALVVGALRGFFMLVIPT